MIDYDAVGKDQENRWNVIKSTLDADLVQMLEAETSQVLENGQHLTMWTQFHFNDILNLQLIRELQKLRVEGIPLRQKEQPIFLDDLNTKKQK